MLATLRSGSWLTPSRLRGYPAVFLGLWIVGAVAWIAMSEGIMDPWGRPLGSDFMGFWATAQLLLSGDAVAAYDEAAVRAAHVAAAGTAEVPHYTMLYPPPGLLQILPLGLMPYLPALALWMLGSAAAYLAVLWAAWRHPLVPYLALAAPAVFVTVGHGQNAFLSGALLGGGLLLLPRRPLLAGVLFGLMVYKPHLGLVLPLALAAGRQWRAFAAAAVTVVALSAASTVAFGWEIWPAYVERAGFAAQVLTEGLVPFFKMQSFYTSLRLLGVAAGPAYGAHWAVAALALVGLAVLWHAAAEYRLKAAALMTAALLVTPFVYDYDMALLGLPIVLVALDGVKRGFLPWDKTILALAWTAPLLARPIGQVTHLGLGALCIGLLYVVILRRAVLLRDAAAAPP